MPPVYGLVLEYIEGPMGPVCGILAVIVVVWLRGRIRHAFWHGYEDWPD